MGSPYRGSNPAPEEPIPNFRRSPRIVFVVWWLIHVPAIVCLLGIAVANPSMTLLSAYGTGSLLTLSIVFLEPKIRAWIDARRHRQIAEALVAMDEPHRSINGPVASSCASNSAHDVLREASSG